MTNGNRNGKAGLGILVGVVGALVGVIVTLIVTYGGMVGRFGSIEQAVFDVRDDVRTALVYIDDLETGYTALCERLATLEALTRRVTP